LRLHFLAQVFAIDLCAYAVMSNHYHVVLHINESEMAVLGDDEIVERWQQLHQVPEWFNDPEAEEQRISKTIAVWRHRLVSISWFMKSLNEPLARMANKEDGCKGRFWEGRFRSQALLDETSVLKCMAYVDLNPIRAKLALTPEASDHTSIKARIEAGDKAIAPMQDDASDGFKLPITKTDYLELVDWTGRLWRPDKRGRIDGETPSIAQRLHIDSTDWRLDLKNLTRRYGRAIGTTVSLITFRDWLGQTRLNGLTTSQA